MDCNKEEAVRAKALAEKKLQSKDFLGARKIALKAQQLYPDLENISQLLMVCDVHCSAEKKFFGSEMDWYGILQVEQAADEATIRKQYRKFALSLHPDKNKFAGAEAAFKLIGEAQRVLLDRDKRSTHDMKRNASMSRSTARASSARPSAPYQPPQSANQNSNVGFQNTTRNVFSGFNAQHQQAQQPAQPGFSNGRQTFWTVCPFCRVRYQYYREIINKSLTCPSCQKTFLACEAHVPGVSPFGNAYKPTVQHQKVFPDQGARKVQVGCKRKSAFENDKSDILTKTQVQKERTSKRRGRQQEEEFSEISDTSNSSDSDDDSVICEDGDFRGRFNSSVEQVLRRSTRQKQKVSYKENASDDEDVNSPKGSNGSRLSSSTRGDNNDASLEETPNLVRRDGLATELNKRKKGPKLEDNDCSGGMEEPEFHDYPDPDFNDFSKDRKEDCFRPGQVWAAYDTFDAMPRFYALIRKVDSTSFQVRITWLEPDPDDVNEISWNKEGLPVSCGKFKAGRTLNADNCLMFSHAVFWEKGSCKETYKVYPQVGETWALFKNWDINWHSDPGNHKKFEYDIVEILSEYAEGFGISVAYLGKVKGFTSLFSRTAKAGISSFQIHVNELYRFSHRVPSYRMTGDERGGVPKGSFELDPASMPMNLEESVPPEDPKVNANGIHSNAACYGAPDSLESQKQFEEKFDRADLKEEGSDLKEHSSVRHNKNSGSISSNCIEIEEPEFFDFDSAKSPKKFQVGQVWALYSDEESLPKYYGLIMNVYHEPKFKLQLKWLTSHYLPSDVIMWHDKDMPICCGQFRILRDGTLHTYTSTDSFSHCLNVERQFSGKTETFRIFPHKGEVWALYKNWSPGMKCSELHNSEYDMVEVIEQNDLWFKVVALELVEGFKSVFKPQVGGDSNNTFEIPKIELMRFSHQVPAFRLTDEGNGSLRGFWELDPAALPLRFFNLN